MNSKNQQGLIVEENVPLGPLTTFKIGGPARYFVRATTERDVARAFELAESRDLPVFVLGGGSNILVSDDGFDGLVIQTALHGIEREGERVTAAAGEDWDAFVEFCVQNDLAGVECLSGIPGWVGGTPVQNVGAYGQEVAESIESVRCFDRRNAEIINLANSDCGFSYRKSIFNTSDRDRYVVLSVTFRLRDGGGPKIAYKDLKEHFGDRMPTLAETRAAVIEIRRRKSMVIDPADPNSRSAGSFFKNPVVTASTAASMAAAAGVPSVPTFAAEDGLVKVPAAWLIERAGFEKGFRLGNAAISANHSLALVNLGEARAKEITALKGLIQDRVSVKFGVELQPEPIFIGFE